MVNCNQRNMILKYETENELILAKTYKTTRTHTHTYVHTVDFLLQPQHYDYSPKNGTSTVKDIEKF